MVKRHCVGGLNVVCWRKRPLTLVSKMKATWVGASGILIIGVL